MTNKSKKYILYFFGRLLFPVWAKSEGFSPMWYIKLAMV